MLCDRELSTKQKLDQHMDKRHTILEDNLEIDLDELEQFEKEWAKKKRPSSSMSYNSKGQNDNDDDDDEDEDEDEGLPTSLSSSSSSTSAACGVNKKLKLVDSSIGVIKSRGEESNSSNGSSNQENSLSLSDGELEFLIQQNQV